MGTKAKLQRKLATKSKPYDDAKISTKEDFEYKDALSQKLQMELILADEEDKRRKLNSRRKLHSNTHKTGDRRPAAAKPPGKESKAAKKAEVLGHQHENDASFAGLIEVERLQTEQVTQGEELKNNVSDRLTLGGEKATRAGDDASSESKSDTADPALTHYEDPSTPNDPCKPT
eukprot:CAMPEP_0172166552 /NCGR_PEP_ID=MMETSP1050-20130122/9054_1 /TAXON_ID=233186 /ORGANISM="Cryptomonas curvata, Strain CCAP979/52" /LENGTH=173 /DNA_ID=CAMNT_0012837193 /DNA_START=245 /DNA_END=763 /DNA_ORIENTATION=-